MLPRLRQQRRLHEHIPTARSYLALGDKIPKPVKAPKPTCIKCGFRENFLTRMFGSFIRDGICDTCTWERRVDHEARQKVYRRTYAQALLGLRIAQPKASDETLKAEAARIAEKTTAESGV